MRRLIALVLLLLAITPTASGAYSIDADEKLAAEKNLHRLGLPTGKVDGVWDEQTRRAICAWRELSGGVPSRKLLGYGETLDLAVTSSLSPTSKIKAGLNFNLQCQIAILIHPETSKVVKVFKISSGKAGYETRLGNYKVGWVIDGWYESHRYPGAMMYRPMFFNQGQALHGSKSDGMVKAFPASHGCVRMMQADIDFLWKQNFKVGSTVHVYGVWKS